MFEETVNESIKELILEVSKNPLLHFSEKSLQVRLAARLVKYPELSTPIQTHLYERYEKQIGKLKVNESYVRDALCIAPLQMEYGTNDPGPHRIDIAILGPEEIRHIDNWQFQKQGKYLIPVIGIEIGTEKTGMGKVSDTHLRNDAYKLRNSKRAYILNVLRNTNVCGKRTISYQKKAQQLESFRDSLRSMSRNPEYSQINWIGLIVHLAYQEVEFLDNSHEWKTYTMPCTDFEDEVSEKLLSAT